MKTDPAVEGVGVCSNCASGFLVIFAAVLCWVLQNGAIGIATKNSFYTKL